MINYHELRLAYRTKRNPPDKIILAIILTLLMTGCVMAATIPDKDAINAIIGEAEGESYLGKIAIAKTIINRGTLNGVYGLHAKRVVNHKYNQRTYNDAKTAWEYAKSTIDNGDWDATGWGNLADVQQFKRQGWFKHCVITAHIGNHYFYKTEGSHA